MYHERLCIRSLDGAIVNWSQLLIVSVLTMCHETQLRSFLKLYYVTLLFVAIVMKANHKLNVQAAPHKLCVYSCVMTVCANVRVGA